MLIQTEYQESSQACKQHSYQIHSRKNKRIDWDISAANQETILSPAIPRSVRQHMFWFHAGGSDLAHVPSLYLTEHSLV